MGHNMYIQAKEETNLEELNAILTQMGLKHSFLTSEDNQLWLDDINNNINSPQRHLKPEGRNLTLTELKKCFPAWTEVGKLSTDLYFGRTSEEEMKLLAEFIFLNQFSFSYITDAEMLIERGKIDEKYHSTLLALNHKDDDPKKLPEEKQYIPKLESGILLCKSWNDDHFWVVFGKVKKAKFMNTKIYEDDLYNSIYKDPSGLSYLLIPLNDFSYGFGEKVFSQCWEMGLRENPYFFLSYVYNYEFSNIKNVAEEFKNFYSVDELKERLWLSLKHMNSEIQLIGTDRLNFERGMLHIRSFNHNSLIRRKLDLVNAFLLSLKNEKNIIDEFIQNYHTVFEV